MKIKYTSNYYDPFTNLISIKNKVKYLLYKRKYLDIILNFPLFVKGLFSDLDKNNRLFLILEKKMKFFIFKILKIIFRVLNIPQITKVKIFNFELIRTKKFFKFQNIYNKNFNEYENRIISVAYKSSMMNSKRLWNILECSKDVIKNNIEGDFVECGVFKGGGIILMSSIISKLKIKKGLGIRYLCRHEQTRRK